MPNQNEYKQRVGIDSLYYALVTKDDADGYVTGAPVYLAPVASLKQSPKTDSQVQYFDDAPFEEIDAEGATDLEFEISSLPSVQYAELLGNEFDAVGGRVYDDANPSQAPYFALGFRSKKSNGSYRYYWFNKVRLSRPSEEFSTQADKADPKKTMLKATALKSIYKFLYPSGKAKGCKRVFGDEDTPNFDGGDWFAAVQTPASASPSALACSPNPADAATGVAISANIILTFSNRIRSGNTGILLTSAAGVPVDAAYSWNATGTILTINPVSDLGAAADYLVTLAGVTDIYGQILANTVYRFTTA